MFGDKLKFQIPDSHFNDEFSRKKRGIPWFRQPKTVTSAPFSVDCRRKTQANVAHPSIHPAINHLLPSRWWAHTVHDYLRSHFPSDVREQTLKLTNQVKLLSLCLPQAPKWRCWQFISLKHQLYIKTLMHLKEIPGNNSSDRNCIC